MRTTFSALALALVACVSEGEKASVASSAQPLTETSQLLSWGTGDGQLGVFLSAKDRAARGPSAVAVGPQGQVVVLDGVNGRVMRVEDGKAVRVSRAPKDADDLTVGPDGAIGVLGALSGKVSLFNPDGDAAGEVLVPRLFRDVDGVAIGPSRRIIVTNAFQERWVIGSPSVPMPVDVALRTKREGIAELPDGRGLAVSKTEAGIEMLVFSAGADERTRVDARWAVAPGADAARIVGVSGNIACMRVERLGQGSAAIDVARQAVCVDATTGREALRRDLPAPGLYVPRHELAFGGVPATLAFVHPEDSGLRVMTWTVGKGGAR